MRASLGIEPRSAPTALAKQNDLTAYTKIYIRTFVNPALMTSVCPLAGYGSCLWKIP